MSKTQIKNLGELLGLEIKDVKLIYQKINRLTDPGENYGGMLYAVDVTAETSERTEDISVVAKTVPPNKIIQEIFRTHITFKAEIYFYKTIIPLLKKYQQEHGVEEVIDFSAKFLGGRVSLNKQSDKVDDDAVLILENLNGNNYSILDRFQGANLDESKLIIKDLAHLHAIPIALKVEKPELFEKKIKSFLLLNYNRASSDENYMAFYRIIGDKIATIEDCVPFLNRVRRGLEKFFVEPRELFSTISHNDCWINNVMIKFDCGKGVKSKLIDFQLIDYGSAARDLLFFLFTSVKNGILEQFYDELIKFYYDNFISVLRELNCDTEEFSFDAFLEEIDYEARNTQFSHICGMIMPLLRPKGIAKDITEFSIEDMYNVELTELHKEKFAFIVKQFAMRNWI